MSSIHPHLDEVIGGRQSITGSKHNSFYHFWKRFKLSHKNYSVRIFYVIKLVYIESTCGTTTCTCANMNQYIINIIFHIMHSERQIIKDKNI
ncbi:hypothetical protein BHE74_00015924 [Ensete ventricosum]|nr:hypothetical protein GW17_00020164 [Ensete ventricosum]RWW76018.1 hypothetical protein BHE74_00015924 [Ensete ventricosum]